MRTCTLISRKYSKIICDTITTGQIAGGIFLLKFQSCTEAISKRKQRKKKFRRENALISISPDYQTPDVLYNLLLLYIVPRL